MNSKKDRWQALYDFWSSFGIPAYKVEAPEGAEKPYIVFQGAVGSFESIITLNASIWDRTTKGTEFIDKKADEIEKYIETMGCPEIEGGRYRVYTGETFAQDMSDPDPLIKRKVLTVNFEFMT